MARSALTPGRLCSLPGAEFRAVRAKECGARDDLIDPPSDLSAKPAA